MWEAERAARPRSEVAVKRPGKRENRKKKPSSAARPTRLSSSREVQVCFAMTRRGMPSRFQSERRGERETRSQARRCRFGAEDRSKVGSVGEIRLLLG